MQKKAAIIIPARMASTRYPNKPLALIKGVTLIERVWRIGKATKQGSEVFIATDDERLAQFAESFGAHVLMTSPDCITGTDRVAEAARLLEKKYEIFFSLQGDAVLTPPWVIDAVLDEMLADPLIEIATPVVKLTGEALSDFVTLKKKGSSSGTCAVFDQKRNALYFSKGLIPYLRDKESAVYRHIGLYGYRQKTLQLLNSLPIGPLEEAEKLEQLRALENGIPIRVVPVEYKGRTHGSIDQLEDVVFVEKVIEKEGELLV